MTRRSRAREVALQLLVQRDLNSSPDRAVAEEFVNGRLGDAALVAFAWQLIDGVAGHLGDIDGRLASAADNWRLPRMAAVDRNVLRIGVYELSFMPETPSAAVINEAVELARRFGSADSPAFVNGVLDRARLTITSM